MADNTEMNLMTGGDIHRAKDRGSKVKTTIVGIDLTPDGVSETLMSGAMPVTDNGGSLTIDDGGSSITIDGSVDVSSLPALPTGTNTIGFVGIDGTPTVALTGTPTVALTSGVATIGFVGIDGTPTIAITGTPTVALTGTPTVSLTTGSATIGTVNIAGTPTVALTGTPTVALTGTPTVSLTTGSATIGTVNIAGTQTVTLTTGSATIGAVNIAGTPTVALTGTPTVAVTGVIDVTPVAPAANDYLPVRLTDGSSFTTVTQYTEDAAAASDPVGGMLIARRRDALTAAEVSTDGDNIALNASSKGQLHVVINDAVTVTGSVSVSSLPALAAGSNTIGSVIISGTPTVAVTGTVAATQSGTWNINAITTLPSLSTGSNTIGAVNIAGTPTVALTGTPTVSLTTGSATIGTVNVTSIASAVTVNTHAVTQSGTWNVTLQTGSSTIGTVNVAGTQTVTLTTGSSTIGAVNIAGTPTVALTGTPTVAITGTPTVAITGTPTVTLSTTHVWGTTATAGVDKGVPILAYRTDDTSWQPFLLDDLGYLQTTVTNAITLNAGSNLVGSVSISGTPTVALTGTPTMSVTGVVDVTPAVPAANDYLPVRITDGSSFSTLTSTEYTEDAAAAANPTGPLLLARRRDTLTAAEVSTDGDNIAINATDKGQLHVKLADSVTTTISGTPTVALTGTPTVALTGTPTVSLTTGSSTIGTVNVAGTPTVALTGTPTVALTGTPTVSLTTGSATIGAVNFVIQQTWGGTATFGVDKGLSVFGYRTDDSSWHPLTLDDYQNLKVTHDGPVSVIPGAIPSPSSSYFVVRLTDGSSYYSITEYTEDAAAAANPSGGMLMARRRDTLTAAEVSTDGDVIALNSSSKGQLHVKHDDTIAVMQSGTWNIGSVTTLPSIPTGSNTIGAVSIAGTPTVGITGTPTVAVTGTPTVAITGVADVTPVSPAANDYLPVRITDGSSFLSVTQTEYTEDAAAAANPVGPMLLARRKDTLSAAEVSTDGDVIALNATDKGQLHVKLADSVTTTVSGTATVSVTGTPTVSLTTGSATIGAVNQAGNWTSRTADSSGLGIASSTGDPALGARGLIVRPIIPRSTAVYVATALQVALKDNAKQLSIYNASSSKLVEIVKAYVTRNASATPTGEAREFYLYRFTTIPSTGGAAGTQPLDTAMGTLATVSSSQITVYGGDNDASGLESSPLAATTLYDSSTAGGSNGQAVLFDEADVRQPIILYENEGITIQQDGTTGTEYMSAVIVFRVR